MARRKTVDLDRVTAVIEFMQRDGWAYTGTVEGTSDLIFTKMKIVRASEFPRCVHCNHVIHRSARIWTTLPGNGYSTLCDASPGGHSDV